MLIGCAPLPALPCRRLGRAREVPLHGSCTEGFAVGTKGGLSCCGQHQVYLLCWGFCVCELCCVRRWFGCVLCLCAVHVACLLVGLAGSWGVLGAFRGWNSGSTRSVAQRSGGTRTTAGALSGEPRSAQLTRVGPRRGQHGMNRCHWCCWLHCQVHVWAV